MLKAVLETINGLAMKIFGRIPDEVFPIAISGSARRYWRLLLGDKTYVCCLSPNISENKTFVTLAGYLLSKNINVPRVIGVRDDFGAYVLEDLGDCDLLQFIRNRHLKDGEPYLLNFLRSTIKQLVEFQRLPEEEWNYLVEFPKLDSALVNHDFQYALDNFINVVEVAYDAEKLKGDFGRLETRLLSFPDHLWGLMYRDFQSRNVMISSGKPYFIDFQSSRKGPGIYDLVSFAWQAKASFSDKDRDMIVSLYCEEMEKYEPGSTDIIRVNTGYWALFRILQTLGAYGLRGLREGKKHFIESIPNALDNLTRVLEGGEMKKEFSALYDLASRMASLSSFL